MYSNTCLLLQEQIVLEHSGYRFQTRVHIDHTRAIDYSLLHLLTKKDALSYKASTQKTKTLNPSRPHVYLKITSENFTIAIQENFFFCLKLQPGKYTI